LVKICNETLGKRKLLTETSVPVAGRSFRYRIPIRVLGVIITLILVTFFFNVLITLLFNVLVILPFNVLIILPFNVLVLVYKLYTSISTTAT
jgi:hypothetical protein